MTLMRGHNMTFRGARTLSRRGFLAATGGAAVTAALAGCGGGSYTQIAGDVPGDMKDRIHVVFWHGFAATLGEAIEKLITEFNESQSEIFVEGQYQGSYEDTVQKLTASLIAGQIPDVVLLSEVTWRKMHLAGKLEPLDDYFDSTFNPAIWQDQLIEEGTVKDTVWWTPLARSTPLFYYNKTVFEKAGLPSEGPTTWQDLKDWSPALQEQVKRSLVLETGYASWYFQGAVWAWGGHYSDELNVTLDSPEVLEAGQFIVDLIRQDNAAYLAAPGGSTVDFMNGVTACGMFSTGSLAAVTEGAKDFEVGTTFLLSNEQFGCPTGGSGLGIMRDAPASRKEAAAEFMKFLAQPAKSAQWTIASGYMPCVKAAEEEQSLIDKRAEDPNYDTAINQLPKTGTQDLIRTIVPSAGQQMDNALAKLYSSGISPENLFGNLQVQLQRKADLIRPTYEERYL